MAKNTKRQRTLDEMIGSKASTSKQKGKTENNTIVSSSDNEQATTPKTTATVPKISDDDLEVLRQFDLDMTFGPCTGIARIERFERAKRHDLDPPIRILELINLYPNDRQVTHCIWRDYTL